MTDGSSLSILPVYYTYSNLRAASTLYNRAVQVSNNNYQIVALWHPDTLIIIFGKRLPINNNRRFSSVQHLVIKQSQNYGFILEKCTGCNLSRTDTVLGLLRIAL